MEGLIVLIVLLVVFAPITLSIVAIVKVSGAREELRKLRGQMQHLLSQQKFDDAREPRPMPPQSAPEKIKPPLPKHKAPVEATPVERFPLEQNYRPTPESRPVRPAAKTANSGVEFMMGGKAAAFAGIAILVMGIVFLVGYAIQHNWIGPGTRIVLGLLCGGVLVGVGHLVERKDPKLHLFARVLTGGGSALFYFSVFAAYGIYHLIGPIAAGFGLAASALAVFGLAMAYRSQAVGVLGVLGAFITPLLIGGDIDSGIFPLVYVAVINVPVLLLGVRRKWQLLYNLAFLFTIIHFLVWLEWISTREVWVGMGFAVLYFAEYAALGLLKLRSEQEVGGRTADLVRLLLASFLLLGVVYWLLDEAGKNDWVGAAFLLLALVHAGLARFAFRVLARFNAEILCFLSGGLLFATLALPAQLDREWVSLGWAVEGVALAWFAGRVRSRALQGGAVLLGMIGIFKALLFDLTFYHNPPTLFLNARFAVGMVSAILLGVQGWLAGRYTDEHEYPTQDMLWCAGVVGIVLVFFTDAFWTLGSDEVFSWLITSLVLLLAGTGVLLLAPRNSMVIKMGALLVLLVPIKLMIDSVVGFSLYRATDLVFLNGIIWVQLAIVAVIILFLQPRLPGVLQKANGSPFPPEQALNIMALASAIWMMTWEIMRSQTDWASTAITILWAVCALALILFGMKRRIAAHRYFGLILFGIATFKVLIVDSSELHGLERIAAFIGTGILLLGLSFAYQKASAYFQSLGGEE